MPPLPFRYRAPAENHPRLTGTPRNANTGRHAVPAMMHHRMRIRRHLRSARVSALTSEERREALRAAEKARAKKHEPPVPGDAAKPGRTPEPHAGAQ